MTAVANFESIAAELVRAAPTPKAVAFAEKIADQIRAKGAEWIEARVNELHIYGDVAYFQSTCPVADNRIFYIECWQMALYK